MTLCYPHVIMCYGPTKSRQGGGRGGWMEQQQQQQNKVIHFSFSEMK